VINFAKIVVPSCICCFFISKYHSNHLFLLTKVSGKELAMFVAMFGKIGNTAKKRQKRG